MQLVLSFSTLLASLLVAITLVQVDAAPVNNPRAGHITLPLKRVHQARDDIHPQVLLQQHINRGHSRLARMTGRDAPASHDLRSSLRKRMFLLDHGPGSHMPAEKRFNHQGVKTISKSQMNANQLKKLQQTATTTKNNLKGKGKQGSQNTQNTGTANAAASDSGAGFSDLDLEAALNGGLTAADNPTFGNTLGLDIEANDVGYVATVQIGTPPRNFNILMDSGSADFWVGAENCQSQQGGGCGNHTFLGTQSSSTFVDTNQQFEVTYGSGEVQGDIITDNVNIAGLALNKHTFGVATVESVQFSADTTTFDGLMGVAQSTLSQQGVSTPVQSLSDAGSIPDPIISFKLGRIADGNNDGEVTFGSLDPAKFDAATQTTFANVNTQGFWEGAMSDIAVNGQSLGLNGRTAILDTGTTLIIAPNSDAAAVHAAIPGAQSDGQGGFTIPCTSNATVALTFSGQQFDIDPRDILFSPVNPNDPTGDCVSGISSGQIGGATEWLVGDVFLKNVYFSSDVTKNQITLAKAV
ncbi:acid protease [Schizopora paradoxa]|uniref:Acid protease n=1 Tax=Schizopora paradoxa TaxID=27342 RepID=A0A0H2RMG3_9AGAM|nr:acid protease [Schizopora paradoxa]